MIFKSLVCVICCDSNGLLHCHIYYISYNISSLKIQEFVVNLNNKRVGVKIFHISTRQSRRDIFDTSDIVSLVIFSD